MGGMTNLAEDEVSPIRLIFLGFTLYSFAFTVFFPLYTVMLAPSCVKSWRLFFSPSSIFLARIPAPSAVSSPRHVALHFDCFDKSALSPALSFILYDD
jgi:hypothetical protein